jgi:glycosyltransferase involved in cell wall biosynthesis
LKIGINATCFNNRPSGAKQRFVGLYGDLVNRLPDVEFVVYEPSDCRVGAWFKGAPNVSVRHTPLPSEGRVMKFVNGLHFWDAALSREGFDIFECLSLPLVKAPTGQTLLTIHDIRGLGYESGVFERAAYKLFFEKSVRAADHVITVSEAMKREILGFFPEIPISVIYNGLDANGFDSVSEVDQHLFRQKYNLPSEFILAVGHLERRKNYLSLVDAVAKLRDGGRNCNLLIIGNDSGERKVIQERVESKGLIAKVQILNGLSDLEVRCAYKLCRLLVFPSSYEGFGIPILEAMAAGRPMVLSDIPVFREITQNRSIYFAHDDIEAIAFAIEKVLSSSCQSVNLIEYGNVRKQEFNFHNLASQLEALHSSLMLKSKIG